MADRYAEFDGHRIFYRSDGDQDRAIVLLPGWGCDHTLWRHQSAALAPLVRVIAVDLPGHGQSDAPDIPYTLDVFVRAVEAVLDAEHLDRAAVAGHSMGAMVAYEFARAHRDRTAALIWVDGACGIPIHVDLQMAAFQERARALRAPDYRPALDAFVETLFAPETPAAVRDEVRNAILSTPQHVLASSQESLADPRIFAPEVVDVPAFALFSSSWQPERFIDIFRRILPRLEHQIVTGTGHYPMLEKPAEVTRFLTGAVKRIWG